VIPVLNEGFAPSGQELDLARRQIAAGDAAAPTPLPAQAVSVLYVEDNPANLALVEQILARHTGVRVIGAPSARLGLELARAHRPALVLLDIHLPEMDGYELLARLRAEPATASIPVVALTAQAMPADARRAIEAGFDEYLTKPIDVSVFDAVVRRLLAAGQDRRLTPGSSQA